MRMRTLFVAAAALAIAAGLAPSASADWYPGNYGPPRPWGWNHPRYYGPGPYVRPYPTYGYGYGYAPALPPPPPFYLGRPPMINRPVPIRPYYGY